MEFTRIVLNRLGGNDLSATIVRWIKHQGEYVYAGESICNAETTKISFDAESPASGYISHIVNDGREVDFGSTIAIVTDMPLTPEEGLALLREHESDTTVESTDRRWTYKAELLARRHDVDLSMVNSTRDRITEDDVRAFLMAHASMPLDTASARDLVDDRYPLGKMQRLLIVGGGGAAVQVVDAISKNPQQRAVAIMDDNALLHGKTICGVPIIGAVAVGKALELLADETIDAAVISVGNNIDFRSRIFEEWSAQGVPFANVIHPSAVVGMNVALGQGNVILAFCHIGACARVGNNNFLSAYCSIDHHAILGSHCTFGPGVLTSSSVRIGDGVRFGTGIFIEPFMAIGARCIIGSGCIIMAEIREGSVLKSTINYSLRERSSVVSGDLEAATKPTQDS